MASIIKLKRSLTPGAVPADGSLQTGELAINLADRKLYSSSNGTNVLAVSGDRYNLARSGNTSQATLELTVDNEALSNDSITFIGQSGVIVSYYSSNNTVGIDGAGANAYFAQVARQLEEGKEFFITGAVAGQGNVAFDGTSNVNINVVQQNDSVTLGTHTTGNYVQSIAEDGQGIITVSNGNQEGGAVQLSVQDDSIALGTKTTGNYIESIAEDGQGIITITNGNVEGGAAQLSVQDNSITLGTKTTGDYVNDVTSGPTGDIVITGTGEGANVVVELAGQIQANTTGNAATATKLRTARTITVAGDVSGSASFDGTQNITINTTIQDGSVDLVSDTTGDFVATIAGTANEIEVSNTAAHGGAYTIGLPDDVTVGNDLTVTNDLGVSGNTSVTGNLSVQGDAVIDGNLTVEGAVTYISSTTVNVEDTQLKLAANNVADTSDIGVYGLYNDGTTDRYAGYFRDASDGIFKFYDNLTVEPGVTVDDQQVSYNLGQIEAVIDGGTF